MKDWREINLLLSRGSDGVRGARQTRGRPQSHGFRKFWQMYPNA
jgi:hypothetical protein